jgi:O-succinylbenzoic acid--CoA ligase
MASRFACAGVKIGDHIAVLLPNRMEYVAIIHALMRLGAVLVPLNIRLTLPELRWQIEQADCSLLVCSSETENQAATLQEAIQRTLSIDQPSACGIEALQDFPAQGETFPNGRALALDAVQSIVFTSGTTGRPKGAMLTYQNHLTSAMASAFRLGTMPADRWLICMPLYHVGGLAIILRCCLYGTAVVLHKGFDSTAVNQALDTKGITLVSLVPTMLHWLLEARAESPFPSNVRCVLLGGAMATAKLLQQSLSQGIPVATTYGLTETASQIATASPSDARRKAGSVGKPLLFSQIRIVGDDGKEQPPGEIGEIVVQGPTVMKGYYKQPEATAAALYAGELHTGDMGYKDAEGDLWVVQRRADLIISGGENIYPSEVEATLLTHPAVQAACVVGVTDIEWGQRVAAAVVLEENAVLTAEELIAFCGTRLASYKRPRILRFVKTLPQTASGKVIRDAVISLFSS